MSRVGRLPIAISTSVTVAVSTGNVVSVKGPRSELVKVMNKDVNIAVENSQVVVTRPSDQKEHKALHGLARVLTNNMIIGAEEGFEESLELIGVGYRAQSQSREFVVNLGYPYPVEIEPIEGVAFETPAAAKVVVKDIDKEKVRAAAADIKSRRKPEPYKGKGIKYNNEVIRCRESRTGRK